MDVDIPTPNRGLAEALLSPAMHRVVEERANTAALLAAAQVAKDTGDLARTAHAGTEIGGVDHDRWIGVMTLGRRGVDYAASHQFGTTRQPGAHELNAVLEQLGSL